MGIVMVLTVLTGMAIGVKSVRPHSGPELAVEDGPFFDFGAADEGSLVEHVFRMKNVGDTDLVILNVRPGCSCTKAQPSTNTIAPGATATLLARYNSAARADSSAYTQIAVETNDPKQPTIVLSMAGRIHPIVFWTPLSISFFCDSNDRSIYRDISFSVDGRDGFQVVSATTTDERIAITWIGDGNKRICRLKLNGSFPPGNRSERLKVEMLSNGKKKAADIPIYLMIQ